MFTAKHRITPMLLKENMRYNDLYTLIIPTYNRPELFKKLIIYLSDMQVGFKIIVLDSSFLEISKKENEKLCIKSSLSINYYAYPDKTALHEKWLDGLKKVTTEYVSFCADDDIVFPEAIISNIDFLSENHEYIACHGNYINFDENNNSKMYVEYCGTSIDGNVSIQRFWQLMSNYEAINYAIFRTNVLQEALVKSKEFSSNMYWELFMSVYPLIRGKVKRLPLVYIGRKSEPKQSVAYGPDRHPLTFFTSHSEMMFSEYVRYRNALMQAITEYEFECDHDKLKRQIDLIHSVYFIYSCDINHIIGLLNNELHLSVPVSENTKITCVPVVNHYVKQNCVSKYDMICAVKELQRYNLSSALKVMEPK